MDNDELLAMLNAITEAVKQRDPDDAIKLSDECSICKLYLHLVDNNYED